MPANNSDDAVWRFDDGGLMAGPYSWSELEAFVASGYLQPDTEIFHENGQRQKAKRLGLFGETGLDERDEADQGPRLWNPNAAINWSLLLTPAFGTYLHAANWRTLGKPRWAAANRVWFWITIAFLVLNLGLLFLPHEDWAKHFGQVGGFLLLLGWYFTLGRSQATYVEKGLENRYVKKEWGVPLLAGFAAVGGYLVLGVITAVIAYHPEPHELAEEVKPLILQKWRRDPEAKHASITNITLVHETGNIYVGFVEAAFAGKPQRLPLRVTLDGQNLLWDLSAPRRADAFSSSPSPPPREPQDPLWAYNDFIHPARPLLEEHDAVAEEFAQIAQQTLAGGETAKDVVSKIQELERRMIAVREKLEELPAPVNEIQSLRGLLVQMAAERTQMIQAARLAIEEAEVAAWEEFWTHRRQADQHLDEFLKARNQFGQAHGITFSDDDDLENAP